MTKGYDVFYKTKTYGQFSVCHQCGRNIDPKFAKTVCYTCKTHSDHIEKSLAIAKKIKNSTQKHALELIYERECRYCLNIFTTREIGKFYCNPLCKEHDFKKVLIK